MTGASLGASTARAVSEFAAASIETPEGLPQPTTYVAITNAVLRIG